MNDQRRQLVKESAMRLELEDKIMTHMQQKLTHNRAAKYSQRLTSKITNLKKEKVKQPIYIFIQNKNCSVKVYNNQ